MGRIPFGGTALPRLVRQGVLTIGIVLAWVAAGVAQMSPEEHASHHSGQGKEQAKGGEESKKGMGGGMGDMGKMMEGMGAPPPKELYPALMVLPDLPPEKRDEVARQAGDRMAAGIARLSGAVDQLAEATLDDDYASMQQATARMREGLAQFESGLAARRALAEGRAPRSVALKWFKREMDFLAPEDAEDSQKAAGPSWFHLFTMALLIAFALAMVAMYFFKMRRAAALFGRIEAGTGPPPPGSAPPLAGAPGPPTPPPGGAPKGKTPPPGETPPAADANAAPPAVPEATSASPLTANWRGYLRVGGIVTETPSVKTFRLLPLSRDRFLPFTFVPGQFLNVAFSIGGARMNRSYSISSSPMRREYVELTVRREPRGAVSRHIVDLLKMGDQIEAGGPVGKFTFTGTEADSIVLIAGGVGITPMMSITRYLTERSWTGDIFFVYTCRTPADFIFADEVEALQRRNRKLHVAVTISQPEGTDWKGARGRITKEWLLQTVPELGSRRTHLCGPPAMMDSVKAIFAELGVPPDHLKTEAFGLARPAPAAPGAAAKPTGPATGPLVTFSKNHKSAKIRVDLRTGDSPPQQTILELSEELGIGIEFSCRVGTCGLCKVKMTSGEVEMEVQDALDDDDKTNGIILACQAKPRGEVTVEA